MAGRGTLTMVIIQVCIIHTSNCMQNIYGSTICTSVRPRVICTPGTTDTYMCRSADYVHVYVSAENNRHHLKLMASL